MGLSPGWGRSPGGGYGNPLQYSCLENPMDRGAWWATVHRVVKSWTWLKWLSTAALAARIGVSVQLNSYPSAFKKDWFEDPWGYKNLRLLNPLYKWHRGTVQWLRLHASNAPGLGLIPGQGTTSHKLQLKTPHVACKTWHGQINMYI